jgi:redox-sensitive bicupin YhaK (pirin superfamily)
MITIRKANERGHADHGWLNSWHTFSFADYYDPKHMHFRSLRVINDDVVAGGAGFGMHPHRDMEIISYIVSGALQHKDSMGNTVVTTAGNFQQMSAGSGVMHSEFNYSPIEPVRLLQIWIIPDAKGVKPSYAEKQLASAPAGKLHLAASKSGRDGSLAIHQDADLYLAKFNGGETLTHALQPQRHAWVQVATGEITVNGQQLREGDAAALSNETAVTLSANGAAQVLLFDLN